MTVFAIIVAIYSVIVTVSILGVAVEVSRLKQRVEQPRVKGSVKISKQLRDGLIDIDLTR